MRRLVLFETASNQRYLFETNRRALAAGASELTRRSTIDWVIDALGQLGIPQEWEPVSAHGPVFLSSGSALVVIDAGSAPDLALSLTSAVTLRALEEAPGLRLYSAWSDPFDWNEPGTLHAANTAVHRRINETRHRLPDADTRFQRLPWVAECPESGLPANRVAEVAKTLGAFSLPVHTKSAAANDGYRHLRANVLASVESGQRERIPLAKSYEELDGRGPGADDEEGWVAIIHADGNGVGQLFLDFEGACGTTDNAGYATALGEFSRGLESATVQAFADAVVDLCSQLDAEERDTRERPGDLAFPMVLAGDDLTCQITGRRAVRFAHCYLRGFLDHTSQTPAITGLNGCRRGLGAAAGIAIVKPHFPFWQAYRLAEDLCASAKQVKRLGAPALALDVHVLFDSVVSDLDDLRARATGPSGRSWGGPYIVTSTSEGTDAAEDDWTAAHRFDDLARAFETLTARGEDDERIIPSRVAHRLRAALLDSPEAVPVVLDDIEDGPRRTLISLATGQAADASVFLHDGEEQLTRLVDAMTLADLGAGVTASLSAPNNPAPTDTADNSRTGVES